MSTRAQLSETLNKLLPGEKNKRIREAILAGANYSGQRTQQLRKEIDEENRLQDGKLQDGTVSFIDATNVELDLFAWVINYQIFQPGFTTLVVPTFDPDFAAIGVFTGTALGTIKYYQGAIDGDGNAEFPQIDEGEIILREVLRNTDGTITTTPGGGGGGNFVSKSAPGTQIIKSDFGSEKLKGTFRDSIYTDANGVFRKTRVEYHGVYSTVEGTGATDWSKLVTINVSSAQLRYFVMLEFAGVSPTYEKGTVWIQFTTDGSGNLTVNALKVFGEINPAKLKLVKLDANTYAVFVHHNEAAAFFKFRPQFSFGPSSVYTYHHQDGKAPLPAGTQYDFEAYGGSINHNDLLAIQGGNSTERYHLSLNQWEGIPTDSYAPSSTNKFVTVSALNSYAYVQEAPINGSPHYRKDGVWVAFTPFAVAGTPTDGHVVTSVAGVATWAAPSGGGGGSKWTDVGANIYRNSAVAIGMTTIPTGATFAVQNKGVLTDKFIQFLTSSGVEFFSAVGNGVINLPIATRMGNPVSNILTTGPTFKAGTSTGTVGFRILNSLDSILIDLSGNGNLTLNGNLIQSSSLFRVGNPAAPTAWGTTIKGLTNFSGRDILLVMNAAEAHRFSVQADGKIFMNNLPSADPLLSASLYKYNDGTRTYLCISEG